MHIKDIKSQTPEKIYNYIIIYCIEKNWKFNESIIVCIMSLNEFISCIFCAPYLTAILIIILIAIAK
jgi:hypothetical protein